MTSLSLHFLCVKIRHSECKVCTGVPSLIPSIWFLWVANASQPTMEMSSGVFPTSPAPSPPGERIGSLSSTKHGSAHHGSRLTRPQGSEHGYSTEGRKEPRSHCSQAPGCPSARSSRCLKTDRPNSVCGVRVQAARTGLGGPPGAHTPPPFTSLTSFQTDSHTQAHKHPHNTTFVKWSLQLRQKMLTYMAWQKMAELSSFFLVFSIW